MFSLLARRVVSRAATPAVLLNTTSRLTFPLLVSASRPVWSRSLLTTAQVLEPATATVKKPKSEKTAGATKKKPTAKKGRATKAKGVGKKKEKKKAEKPKPKKVPKDQLPPRKPPSSFLLFLGDFRSGKPRSTNISETLEICKDAAKSWNTLSEQQKQRYHDLFLKKRETYRNEMADYLKNTPQSIIDQLNKKRKPGSPMLRAGRRRNTSSSFALFFAEWSAGEGKTSGNSMVERMKNASQVWKGMSAGEKQPFTDRAKVLRDELKASAVAEA